MEMVGGAGVAGSEKATGWLAMELRWGDWVAGIVRLRRRRRRVAMAGVGGWASMGLMV